MALSRRSAEHFAVWERRTVQIERVIMKVVIVVGIALLVSACTATSPRRIADADPADPTLSIAPARYASELAAYRSRRPVEPEDWKGTNERVAPQPRRSP
jgi:hypothetical protein